MDTDFQFLNISLSPEVEHISKVACMMLSGTIQNGLFLTQHLTAHIIIYKDRIDFGKCLIPEFYELQGPVPIPQFSHTFFKEHHNIVYRYINNLHYSSWNKTIDYSGFENLKPTVPDNQDIFDLIYPRIA